MKVDIDKIVIEKDIRKCVSKCGLLTSLLGVSSAIELNEN